MARSNNENLVAAGALVCLFAIFYPPLRQFCWSMICKIGQGR